MVAQHKPLPWYFKDPDASDFCFSGNLLADVNEVVEDQYTIELPFGIKYRPDIALLGPRIHNKQILLGIIELELTHEAELLKCLFCKTTGAPLFLVNLRDSGVADINDDWCSECISQTTQTTEDGRRDRNYVLLHTMLYPVFTDAPREMFQGEKHQFLIFVKDESFDRLPRLIERLKATLGLPDSDVTVSPVRLNPNDRGSKTMFENEGKLAGDLWREYNSNRFIRVAVQRPISKSGTLFQFHLVLTTMLTAHFDALVGYKYGSGVEDYRPDDPLWIWYRWDVQNGRPITHRLLPKHLSEPVQKIVSVINRSK
jgi:hypothetical protein